MSRSVALGIGLSALFAATAIGALPAMAASKPMSCTELAKLALPHTTITSATIVPAGPFSAVSAGDPYAAEATTSPAPTCSSNITAPQLPAFCRVTAGISEKGAAEPINIEVWLPTENWNGRLESRSRRGLLAASDVGSRIS